MIDGHLITKNMKRLFRNNITKGWAQLQAESIGNLIMDVNAFCKGMRHANLLDGYPLPLKDPQTTNEAMTRRQTIASARKGALQEGNRKTRLKSPAADQP